MKLHSFEVVKDHYLGKRGTAEREDYEYRLQCELVSEAIKEAREARNLTHETLSQLAGVEPIQIQSIENNLLTVPLQIIIRVSHVLGLNLFLQVSKVVN